MRFWTPLAVHPRVCGEQAGLIISRARLHGSSPRVRGTGFQYKTTAFVWRFIPACAGNSSRIIPSPRCRPVHPRVCGEQFSTPISPPPTNGSSPRVRGTAPVPPHQPGNTRFIPACAGNSENSSGWPCRWPVHPRVCGEQLARRLSGAIPHGSSPRVRGTAVPALRQFESPRFIPACAGNRQRAAEGGDLLPVHPRVCGEQYPC